jgi:hypothetical protein
LDKLIGLITHEDKGENISENVKNRLFVVSNILSEKVPLPPNTQSLINEKVIKQIFEFFKNEKEISQLLMLYNFEILRAALLKDSNLVNIF